MSSLAIADPEVALAVAYAPRRQRQALATLWHIDERLAPLGDPNGANPAIAQIKLAWWHEALAALDRGSLPAEPLLQDVAAHLLPRGVAGAELGEIAMGWSALLDDGEESLADHARDRGGRLFAIAARLLTGSESAEAAVGGEAWALIDVVPVLRPDHAALALALARERSAEVAAYRWPAALRPLGMLAMLARRDATAGTARRQGSPQRIARMLRHRFTGR